MTHLPKPDTHCFDDDTQKDVWSHSTEQMLDYGKAEPDAQDAKRYRWLRDAPRLSLLSDATHWVRPDGTKFVSTHYLASGGTQYAAAESLDAAIDAAMEKPCTN